MKFLWKYRFFGTLKYAEGLNKVNREKEVQEQG